jgi:hypothetical protein
MPTFETDMQNPMATRDTRLERLSYDSFCGEDKRMGKLGNILLTVTENSTSSTPHLHALQQLQDTFRCLIDKYRYNRTTYGGADQRIRKDWSWEIARARLRLFPSAQAKALEENASVYAAAQREGNEDLSPEGVGKGKLEKDWKVYNGLLEREMDCLARGPRKLLRVSCDEAASGDGLESDVLHIAPLMACRIEEVSSLQRELKSLVGACRDLGKAEWFCLGRIVEILAPTDRVLFGEVERRWRGLKGRFLPRLWDVAYMEGEKAWWIWTLGVEDRVEVEHGVEVLRGERGLGGWWRGIRSCG